MVEDLLSYLETMTDENAAAYWDAITVVMGDQSDLSRQNAQRIEWAYDSLLSTVAEAGELTEEAVREIAPAQTLRLAIDVDWIPYLDDNGDPYCDKVGELEVGGYDLKREYYEAFLRLLPIEKYVEFIKQSWATSPKEIIDEVQRELGWGDPEFVEAMQIENDCQWTNKDGETVPVEWRDSKERYGLKKLRQQPAPNSRPRKAQTDHRRTAWRVIVKHSRRYAELPFEKFDWRKE